MRPNTSTSHQLTPSPCAATFIQDRYMHWTDMKNANQESAESDNFMFKANQKVSTNQVTKMKAFQQSNHERIQRKISIRPKKSDSLASI